MVFRVIPAYFAGSTYWKEKNRFMPLITNKIRISDGYILTWQLEESVEQLEQMLPEWLDLTEYLGITHPQKKREWLAGRHLFTALCKMAGIPFQGIWKSPDGKPFLLGSTAHISLSHAEHLVVAALHFTSPIGIDLEKPREQLQRIAPKFLSPAEQEETKEDLNLLCQYWSAKEAVYKLIGEKKISLRKHIRLPPPDRSERWEATVSSPEIHRQATLQIEWLSGYFLAIAQNAPGN